MKYIKNSEYFGGGSIVLNGMRIFNPTHAQMLEAGWEVYTPPARNLTPKDYENAVQNHIDATARTLGFDNIQTCTKYAGFDNAFKTHAEALLTWNASCWLACRTIMAAVQAGTLTQPTIAELVAELPSFSTEGGEV